MPIAASPFFWDSFSRFEQIKLWLGFQPQPIKDLKHNLEKFSLSYFTDKNDKDTPTAFHLAVAYLADYSDPAMEAVVRKKLAKASLTESSNALADLIDFSLKTDREKMVKVSERIIELNVLKKIYKAPPDIPTTAKRLLQHSQKKERKPQAPTSQSTWGLPLPKLKTIRYLPYYSLSTLAMAYGVDLAEKPSSRWMAQSQLTFFRSTLADLIWLWNQYMALFSSVQKALVVAGCIFASIATIYSLYSSTYHALKPAPSFDKQLFINLSEKAEKGLISPSIGRDKELRDIETCLSPVGDIAPRIVILLGPPGAGKTQVMEGLALKMKQRKTAHLNDKTFMVMNTANMGEKGTWTETRYSSRVDMTLETIEGSESQIIIGFDEAHMLDKKTADRLLKTEVNEKKLSLILATTWSEFIHSHLNQDPIRERSQIVEICSMDEANTKFILLKYLNGIQEFIEVTPQAIDELLKISALLPGAEPRKSKTLLNILIQSAYAAIPQEPPLLPVLKHKYEEKLRSFNILDTNKTYRYTTEGKKELDKLDLIQETISNLEEFHKKRVEIFNKIHQLKKTQMKYLNELDSLNERFLYLTNLVSQEKRYIFITYCLLPNINNKLKSLTQSLSRSYPPDNSIVLVSNELLTDDQFGNLTGPMQEDIGFIIDSKTVKGKKNELTQKYFLNLKNGATDKSTRTSPSSSKQSRKHKPGTTVERTKSDDPPPHQSYSTG